jgi:hypothetical protein
LEKRACATRGEPCEPKQDGFCCRNYKHTDLECRRKRGKVFACWDAKEVTRYGEFEKAEAIDTSSVDKREDEEAIPEKQLERRQFNCQPQGRKCDPSKPNKCCSPNDCDKKRKTCRPHWEIIDEEMRDWLGAARKRSEQSPGEGIEEGAGEPKFSPDSEIQKPWPPGREKCSLNGEPCMMWQSSYGFEPDCCPPLVCNVFVSKCVRKGRAPGIN